jgi:AraC-like DNA-binding protein
LEITLQKTANNFDVRSEVIFNGSFCGSKSVVVEPQQEVGHLHLLCSGSLTIESNEGHRMCIDEPALILLPRGIGHSVNSARDSHTKLLCTAFRFQNFERQLVDSLPRVIVFKAHSPELKGLASLLFNEIDQLGVGQQSVVNKICDVLLIKVIRLLIDNGHLFQGMLAGLSHPKLSRTIAQLQNSPESNWSLEEMASQAGMSRSTFAQVFLNTVGQTPNDFLTDLRVNLAKELLEQDKSVSLVANSVGYEHGSALARVFRKKTGFSPKQWQSKLHNAG